MLNTLIGLGASYGASKLVGALKNQKVNVLHAAPGRVRLQCDRWKNKETAAYLEAAFRGLPIVEQATASEITGSLLIVFKVQSLTAKQFDEIVRHAVKISEAALPDVKSDTMKLLELVTSVVDKSIKVQSGGRTDLDSLLVLGFILSGTSVLGKNPSRAASLLLGAYNIIIRNRKDG